MSAARPAKRRVVSPHVSEPPPKTWSNCVVVGDHVYIAGVYASTEPGLDGAATGDGMYAQAVAVFTKIRHLVEAAGGAMNDVVTVMIFVTDIGRRHEIWKARREFFSGDFPPSTMVEGRALASPDLLIAAEAVAVLGSGRAPAT